MYSYVQSNNEDLSGHCTLDTSQTVMLFNSLWSHNFVCAYIQDSIAIVMVCVYFFKNFIIYLY
jgi:hypothetical protein